MDKNIWIGDFVDWMLDCSKEFVRAKAEKLKKRFKGLSNDDIVDKIVFGEAIFSDDIGITTGLIKTIPTVGNLVSGGKVLPEIVSVTFRQVYCIIFVAALYERDLDSEDIALQILLVLAMATGMDSVKKAFEEAGEVPVGTVVEKHFKGGEAGFLKELNDILSLQFDKEGVLGKKPLIAIPISAGLNYLNISATGIAAKYFFNDLYFDFVELTHLELIKYKHARAVVSLMMYMAKADKVYRRIEKDIIEVVKENIHVPEKYEDDFKRAVNSPPDWEDIKKSIKQKEAKKALLIQLFLVMYFDNDLDLDEVKIVREVAEKLGVLEKDVSFIDKKTMIFHACSKGLAYDRHNNYEEALKCYNRALELEPHNSDILAKKGNILYKQEKYEEALLSYEKSLKIDGQDKFTWNNKGLSFYNLKKYEDALFCFDKAIELDPDYKYGWSNKGLTLYKMEKYEEAADCYDKILEKDPAFFNAEEKRDDALQMIKD